MMSSPGDNRNRLLDNMPHSYGTNVFTNNLSRIETTESDSDSGYTELLRGSVPCPTCRGIGNVPKEQESQLIALIPLKDDRLKPRRTKLWVCLAVFLCVLTAGLLVFFMFPRTVDIQSLKPYLDPYGPVYINKSEENVTFTVINKVNVSNENYFALEVTSMAQSVLYDTQVIALSTNSTGLHVPMRSKQEYFIAITISLNKQNQMAYMVDSCQNPVRWAHELVMLFDFTCNYNYFGNSEQTTLQTYQFVSCFSDVTTTPKPTTTTTTTTTTQKTTTTTTTTQKITTSQKTTTNDTTTSTSITTELSNSTTDR